MRILDLSVATLIGLSSVVAIAAWNPDQFLTQGQLYEQQASLKDYLAQVISSLGAPWLQNAKPDQICAALIPFSNSTLQVSAEGRYFRCATGPPEGAPLSTITLEFAEGNLSLQAWPLGRQ